MKNKHDQMNKIKVILDQFLKCIFRPTVKLTASKSYIEQISHYLDGPGQTRTEPDGTGQTRTDPDGP